MTATAAYYVLLNGDPLPLLHHGQQITATTGRAEAHHIPDLPPRAAPTQPVGRAPTRRRPADATGTSADR